MPYPVPRSRSHREGGLPSWGVAALIALALVPARPGAAEASASAVAAPASESVRREAATVLPSDGASPLSGPSEPPAVAAAERLALLELLARYAQTADARESTAWAALFTEGAVFSVHPPGGGTPQVAVGREAILAGARERHAELARRGAQRRHLLANPLIAFTGAREAQLTVTLAMLESAPGRPPHPVGAGRYVGRAVRTPEGWRIAEWRFEADPPAAGE